MPLNVYELRRKIRTYFQAATREELYRDCIEAGLKFYSNIGFKIEDASIPSEKERSEGLIFILDEAASVYIVSAEELLRPKRLEICEPVLVRPQYVSEAKRPETANKESNKTLTIGTSANSLTYGDYYGYPFGI